MNKHLIFCFCIILIALTLASCTTAVNGKPLQCTELVKRGWGSGENAFGYEIERPSNTRYKLVPDEAGNIYILDTYNNRIAKFDSAGKFEVFIKTPPPPGEEFEDIAPTDNGHLFAAISAPVEVLSHKVKTYVAIYEFDVQGQFQGRFADWRDSEALQQRLAAGLGAQVPFHFLAAGPGETAYSIMLGGGITQYTPERLSRLIYNYFNWGQVVSGWDGYLYVVDKRNSEDRLLVYESLNGNLIKRVVMNNFQVIKDGTIFSSNLVNVDAAGKLYFGLTDLADNTQSDVYVLSSDGRLERHFTIPGRLAGIGKQGQLYVFTYSKQNIPSGTFSVAKCNLPGR